MKYIILELLKNYYFYLFKDGKFLLTFILSLILIMLHYFTLDFTSMISPTLLKGEVFQLEALEALKLENQETLISLVWIIIYLTLLFSIDNLLIKDYEDGFLDLFIISNIPLELIISIKLLIHSSVYTTFFIVLLYIFNVIFFLILNIPELIYISSSIIILIFLSSIFTSLILDIKQRMLLLYLLIFPLYIPFIIFYKIKNFYIFIFMLGFIIILFTPFIVSYILKKNL